MKSELWRAGHRADLNKIAARLPQAREFIRSCDPEAKPADNAKAAFLGRWYGNAGQQLCLELTRHFQDRYLGGLDASGTAGRAATASAGLAAMAARAGEFAALRRFVLELEPEAFPLVNHLYMLMADPYYRWAASQWLPQRLEQDRRDISHVAFEAALRTRLPEGVGAGSALRYAQNTLTALRDNGLLAGTRLKKVAVPRLGVRALGFMLYLLAGRGMGPGEFDGSPLYHSLLRPRELLVPLFQEGERLGFWDFIGDRQDLSVQLHLAGLGAFMEAIG